MELLDKLTKKKKIEMSCIDYIFIARRFENLDEINVIFEEEFDEIVTFEKPMDIEEKYYAPLPKDMITDDYITTHIELGEHLYEISLFYIKDNADNYYITETHIAEID